MARKRLGEFLLELGLIDAIDLQAALATQKRFGNLLGRILVEMGKISEDDLVTALSHQLNLPVVQLAYKKIAPEVVHILDVDFCLRVCCIAFDYHQEKKFLDVAMADPTNQESLDYIRFKTRCYVRPFLEAENKIKAAIERYFFGRRGTDLLKKSVDPLVSNVEIDRVSFWSGERVIDLEAKNRIDQNTTTSHADAFSEADRKNMEQLRQELDELKLTVQKNVTAIQKIIEILVASGICQRK